MCALPKGFRKNIKITRDKVGPERRQEILDDIANQGTFLPRGVSYEDIDGTFIRFIDEDLEIVIDGEKVPVIFLTLQRWAEFSKTWQHSDKYKNIKMPFITVVRLPNPQVGTNQAGLWNIPGRNTYTYMKVPTNEGGRVGIDVYKIPQPTSVDFTYEVRLFCNRMRDLNKLNTKVQHAFQSIQSYVRVNGHPMPITLQNIGDESNIEDFEKRKFYVQPFEMLLAGYILDEDSFEVIPAVNRAMALFEISDRVRQPLLRIEADKVNNVINFEIIYKPRSEKDFSFIAEYDMTLTNISGVENITNIIIKADGIEKFNGLSITGPTEFFIGAGQSVFISVVKDLNQTCKFQLSGYLI
jgi:hypothetical protein